MILIERGEHGRDLALAESIVKDIVDRLGAHSESRRGRAIDDQASLKPFVLLVAVDIEEAAHGSELLQHAGRPDEEILNVVALQRVLI